MYALKTTSSGRPVAALFALLMFLPAVLLARAFWRRDDRRGLFCLLTLAMLVRVPMLFAPPLWSHDVYRYVWDGRLALRGVDPRAVAPLDPALRADRSSALWPFIDLRSIPSVYPPLAIAVFSTAAVLDRNGIRGAKVLVALSDIAVIAAMWWALRRRALPRGRVALYALHPLVLLSFAQDTHIEAFAIAGIVIALFSARALRVVALAAAILMKLYPAILLPLLAVRDRIAVLATLAVVALAYIPSLLVGHVFGSMRSYLTEQGFNESIALIGAPGTALIFSAAIAAMVWAVWRGLALPAAALVVIVMYLLCTPNVLPWYVAVVPALVAVQERPFSGRFAPLIIATLAWSGTVGLAYAVPWLATAGSALDVTIRIIEYAPIIVAALLVVQSAGPLRPLRP